MWPASCWAGAMSVGLIRNPRLWTHAAPTATPPQIDDLILWLTLGVIVGGRLGHVVFYTPLEHASGRDPLEILQPLARRHELPRRRARRVLAAGFAFARRQQDRRPAAGRPDRGRRADRPASSGASPTSSTASSGAAPTHVPWGMVFPDSRRACRLPRHPSQLYEAALEGIVMFLVLRWATHRQHWLNRRGVVMGLFLTGYGLIRIGLENVREPDSDMPDFPLGLTMGMMLSIPMVLVGAWLIWRGLKNPCRRREPTDRRRPMSLRERLSAQIAAGRADQRRPVHGRLPARSGLRLLRHPPGAGRGRRLHHRAPWSPDVRRADRPVGGRGLGAAGPAAPAAAGRDRAPATGP